MSGTVYVIADEAGEIVSMSQEPMAGEWVGGILPDVGQKLYRVSNVDRDILSLPDPDRFHGAMTKLFHSKDMNQHIADPEAHIYETVQRYCRPMRNA